MTEAGIIQEWGLDPTGLHTREDILAALTDRIERMLMDDPMGFIQLMYRLDIPEDRLDAALESGIAAPLVAQLVWDRQVQKSIQRNSTPPRGAGEEDLEW